MRLSPILRSAEGNRLLWWCPGCKGAHAIAYGPGSGPRWMWNGDVNLPIFNPSVLVTGVAGLTDEQPAAYLRGDKSIPIPKTRRRWTEAITVKGARENNLKNIDVEIPRDKLMMIAVWKGLSLSSVGRGRYGRNAR